MYSYTKNESSGLRHSIFRTRTGQYRHAFYSCDLDLITVKYEFDLGILKLYLHSKNELSSLRLSEVRAYRETNRHAGRCDRKHYSFAGVKRR